MLDVQAGSIWRLARRVLPGWSGPVLDVGCGDGPWRSLLPPEATYFGVDVPQAASAFGYAPTGHRTVIFDGTNFPFADASFSHLLCTEVLEHVSDPAAFLDDCYRITKWSGDCLFSVPFAARYHYVPFDYWRFTPAGLRQLFGRAGWSDIEVIPLGTDVTVAMHKVNALFLRLALGRHNALARPLLLIVAVFLAPLFCVLTLVEISSAVYQLGSQLDPLGYVILTKKT